MAYSAQAVPVKPKRRKQLTEKGKALWVLALLSPVIAEMLSGSAPPREFFMPLGFAFLLGLYGAGVLVVRELGVMWNKGWASLILLGAAYGILEEGVAVKSFFDPGWMDLGGLGEYGRYIGTNWVWAFWLTIYHSAVSICLPILIVSMLYPHLRNERLLTGKKFHAVLLILFLDVLACATLLNPYWPEPGIYVLCILAVFAFVGMAALVPRDMLHPTRQSPAIKPRWFFALGLALLLATAIISGAFVETEVSFVVPISIMLVISALVVVVLDMGMSVSNLKVEKAYFASGMMGFLFLFSLILTINGWFDMALSFALATIFIVDFTRWSRGRRTIVAGRFAKYIYGQKR